jgi:uncharacterized protein (DUF362 family)
MRVEKEVADAAKKYILSHVDTVRGALMAGGRLIECFRESFFFFGLACLVWYVFRSGTKPSRASYPCQRAAAANVNLWAVTYVFPVLSVDTWESYLRKQWKPLLLIVVAVAISAGYMSIRHDGLHEMSPDILSLTPMTASETPQSDIYAVSGTDGADDGVQALIELMAEHGQPFYRSHEEGDLKGSSGLIDAGDVVLIKVNSQWDERGCTNTDLVKNLIEALVAHPDGFKGEIVVADNGQDQYGSAGSGGSLDWERNNALDRGQSIQDVVEMFSDNHRVSTYLWDDITGNVVQEFAEGDVEDGYVVATKVINTTGTLVSYPKFTTLHGTQVSFKYGVYVPEDDDYDLDRLKVINVPVLKTHMIYGVTASVKHYMGVPSDKLTRDLGYRAHDTVDEGGMGTLMAQTRVPTLNIVDAIWVNACPMDGPSSSYASATEVNVVAASTDPVALDYWASKRILCRVCSEVFGADTGTLDPDNTAAGVFGDWLRLSMQELNAAGYMFTCDEDRMNVHISNVC